MKFIKWLFAKRRGTVVRTNQPVKHYSEAQQIEFIAEARKLVEQGCIVEITRKHRDMLINIEASLTAFR